MQLPCVVAKNPLRIHLNPVVEQRHPFFAGRLGANLGNRFRLARIDMRARRVTTSGARFSPFPAGCSQKGHAPRDKALPGGDPGCVLRLAYDLFDEQRVLRK